MSNIHKVNNNIYITSDEEIKEGDYRLNIQRDYYKKADKEGLAYYNKRNDVFKKIILTNDVDLIKEGVQSIDDEFLEWFVKNPSCEEVKIETIWVAGNSEEDLYSYKPVIPQEESKQETIEEAANRVYPDTGYEDEIYGDIGEVFREKWIEGAKWQAERSYSEEEVIDILLLSYSSISDRSLAGADLRKWFEQFSKLKNG
jgi:hypothetical protein